MEGKKPITKVYIDSRFKTKDSKSNSDFQYELVESMQLPDKCARYVDDVIIPVARYNIDGKTIICTSFRRPDKHKDR